MCAAGEEELVIYIGIDPGKAGALVAVSTEAFGPGSWTVVPVLGKDYDLARMAEILQGYARHDLRGAAIERVHAMPAQGVTSMFTFGRGLGLWEGMLSALDIPFERVAPRDWQRLCGPLPKDKRERKAAIVRAAQDRCPSLRFLKRKEWGVADAYFLAEYARRSDLGEAT